MTCICAGVVCKGIINCICSWKRRHETKRTLILRLYIFFTIFWKIH